jgi:TPR repeat protein
MSRPHPAQTTARHLASAAVLALLALGPAVPALAAEDAEILEAASDQAREGHAIQAARALQPLAARGHVQAMERLALMHWYGPALFGAGEWRRDEAMQWLRAAAARESELARYMLAGPAQRVASTRR